MHQLTEAGLSAMAEELFRITVDGERSWDQATPELREAFRSYIDLMVARHATPKQSERPQSNDRHPNTRGTQCRHPKPQPLPPPTRRGARRRSSSPLRSR